MNYVIEYNEHLYEAEQNLYRAMNHIKFYYHEGHRGLKIKIVYKVTYYAWKTIRTLRITTKNTYTEN